MSISSVTSEALQLKLRQLLPSQQGFGTDLSASDTIIPIIDLTAAAEGSSLEPSLQQALSIDGDRFRTTTNASNQVASSILGFVRCFGTLTFIQSDSAGTDNPNLYLFDGTTKFSLLHLTIEGAVSVQSFNTISFDFVYFASSGTSLRFDGGSFANIALSARQLADVNGVLVYPTGFTPS
jgi:hypothetical protein